MATEIERKFLVVSDAWRSGAGPGRKYRQAYLCDDGRCAVRLRISGAKAKLSLKARKAETGPAIVSHEFEYDIPLVDAEEMLRELTAGSVIVKTRYEVRHAGLTWEIDVFEGENAPLVLAEVELANAEQDPPLPPWVGREVSNDERYLNAALARRPYSTWAAAT